MATIVSLEDAMGQEALATPTNGKPRAPVNTLLTLEEATGVVEQPSIGGFLRNPQSYKDMAGYAAGVGAQLSDMFTGLGKSLLGGTAYLIDRSASKGSMVAPAPRTADAPPVTAAERTNVANFSRQASARKAQVLKDTFPDELATPWKKVAEAMGPEALSAYNDNGVGWVMGKISEVIEKGGKAAEGASGLPASDFINAVDLFTGILGARALKPQAQAMLKQRIGQMRSEMKTAKKGRDLTPEELAAAYAGTQKFRPGDNAEVKPTDFEATQEMPAFEKTQPIEQAAPAGPRPLADVLDPYKVPAIVAGAMGATAWALQDQLEDEQLAAMGVMGGMGVISKLAKLDGVPEKNLIDMLKQGGAAREAAAAQIYRDNVPKLTRGLRKYERQGVEIEDVIQRTMEKGLRAIEKGSFAGDAAIGTYLYRIAENEVMSGMRYEKVRPKTESMDMEETPGIGKGDEARPSAHENIADESLTGRSPEQVALNNVLGQKMAKALDSLPENFRRPFEMRELEGMDYAEIAEALGQPIGTVRSQISRAKDSLQRALREYGPGQRGSVDPQLLATMGVTAGAAAVGGMFGGEDGAAAGGLAGLMTSALMSGRGADVPSRFRQSGAIKGKGGMWHPEALTRLARPLEDAFHAAEPATQATVIEAGRKRIWAKKAMETYLNRHAGTATDPLKDIELPDGTRWEDATDAAFSAQPAERYLNVGDRLAKKGEALANYEPSVFAKAAPDEPIWNVDNGWSNTDPAVGKLVSYISHVGDYLKANVSADKLPQYDLVRAVKETKAWDDRMAKEAAKAAEREANTALKRMEQMTVAMDFPGTGLKLVKLDKPGDFAHESTVMGHSVRGYEPYKAQGTMSAHSWYQNAQYEIPGLQKRLGERPLDDAIKASPEYQEYLAKNSVNHPDWVPESEKGMTEARFNSGDPNYGLGGWDAIKRGDAEILSLRDSKGMSHVTVEIDAGQKTWATGEPRQPVARILQIRGKGNAPVPERYQQQIADFLNSREWGEVRDLDNAGIYKVYDTYMTDRDVRPLLKRTIARAAKQDRYTPEQLDSQLKQIDEMDARGVQWAVNRQIQNLEHTLRMERVAAKRGEVLETPEAYNPRDVLRNQRGSASPEQIFTLAAATAGGTLGALLDEESPLRAGIYGAIGGGLLGSAAGRKVVKQAIKSPDWALGLISTRLGKIAPELKGRLRLHELRVLKAVDTVYDQVTPFLDALRKQPQAVQEMIARDLLNGKLSALMAIPALAATYPKVQATLKNIEGQLQGLGRFAEGVGEYFPRIVKDMEGLREALGKADPTLREGLDKALAEANAKMMRKEKRALTNVEESVITNRYLFQSPATSRLPGYAMNRKIKEVTEKLQPFYETPAESLLRYLSGSITDIETARFFGRDLKVNAKGQKKFTNVDESIGNLTAGLLDQGKITPKQAMEIKDILQARFQGGEKGMNQGLALVRNLTNGALLGQFASAATQIGDSLASIYHFGLGPTLQGVVQTVRGKSKVTPKELGLVNHLAEELSDRSASGKVLHNVLRYSGFQAIDLFAKQVNMNAALAKARGQARTAKGQVALAEKYGYAFEGEMPQLIADLQANALTPRTQRLAFEALSDIQPVSRAELPQAYLEHPNGRLLYQLKTYMLKQGDIVRRDAYDNIASGNPKKMLGGLKNLAALATLYAFSNVPGDAIKDWLSGREVDVLSTPQLVENIFKTFGLNRYTTDRLGQGKVVETGVATITPPLKVLEDILAGREKAISYLPGVGRPLYDRVFDGNVKREIAEKKLANKGKPKGTGQELSDEAKEYLERKRQERKEKAEAGQ
jgi:RNA polymerase sigma-70 factor, ECF subfamily